MLTLNDGRSELWQWDTGRTLAVDADCSQVHFSNKVFGRSIDADVIDGAAAIPDILLQTDKDLSVWAFVGTAENGYTKISKTFTVNRRNKPADYVFTPVEQTTIAEIAAIAQSVREDADEGRFDGPQGPAGPAGAPGKDGTNGVDGITPSIGDNGNWYLGTTDTGKPSRGETGPQGTPGIYYGTTQPTGDTHPVWIDPDGGPDDGGLLPVVTAADNGKVLSVVNSAWSAEKMPEALPNPNALTFTGAVTGSYDGSAPVSVEIPSGGGSGGSASLQLLTEDTLTEDIATIYVDGFSADRLAFAVAPYGSTANSGNVNGLFTFGFSDDSSININMNSALVSNTASKAWNKHVFYATVNGNVLYILAKRETGTWDTNIDINILSNFSGAFIKMVLLPNTVKITSLSIGLSSTGVIGANTQFKVVRA